jgi:hypothetical protein
MIAAAHERPVFVPFDELGFEFGQHSLHRVTCLHTRDRDPGHLLDHHLVCRECADCNLLLERARLGVDSNAHFALKTRFSIDFPEGFAIEVYEPASNAAVAI